MSGLIGHTVLFDDKESVDSLTRALESRPLAAFDLGTMAGGVQSSAYVLKDLIVGGKPKYAAIIFPRVGASVALVLAERSDEEKVVVYIETENARNRATKIIGDFSHHINRATQFIPDSEDIYLDR